METEQPPVPAIPTPVTGIGSTVPLCSEKHCRRRISWPFLDSSCDQCLAAAQARFLSHGRGVPRVLPRYRTTQEKQSLRNLEVVSTRKEIPTSVRSRLHSPMDGGSKSFTQGNDMRPHFPVTHRHEHVPSQHLAETRQSRGPPTEYFNKRGEVIMTPPFAPRKVWGSDLLTWPTSNKEIPIARPLPVCHHNGNGVSCRKCPPNPSPPTQMSVIPPPPVKIIKTQAGRGFFIDRNIAHINDDVYEPVPEAEDDLDLENLELKYPEVPEVQSQIPRSINNRQPEHLPANEHPLAKRRKLSHPAPPTMVRVVNADKIPSLLLSCETSNCTGLVSIGSLARRCLSCVRREWKAKREDSKQISSAVQDVGQSNQVSKSTKPSSILRAKKKGVSWADEVGKRRSRSPDSKSGTMSYPNDPVTASNAQQLFTSHEYGQKSSTPDIEDYVDLDELVETGASSSKSTTSALKEKRLKSSTHISDSTISRTLASNSPEHIYGWDSDLSDLTESPEKDSESESSSEEQAKTFHPSVSSGFKIRIPPRPSGAYTLKCSSQRCDQMLPTASRWKSCVLCRARSRDYRRRKQNLSRVDLQLEDELMDSQSMGTPLAAGLVTQAPKDTIKLVPGARLCAIRTCTFIIPPFGEYRWTMCSLCRIRRRERRKKEMGNVNPSPTGSSRHKIIGDANSMLQSLNCLTKLEDTAGRKCRSLDCGLMTSSPHDCRQCTARRLWLVNRRSSNHSQPEGPKLLHRGSKKPMERALGPTPYQRYKCSSAVLLEFKNRLSGFLRVQSIFFLFNQPPSTNALFAFDGEFSVVAHDFDLVKRKEEVDANALKLKREIEYVGRINFSPKRLISVLEGGGISIRFSCFYPVPVLQPKETDGQLSIKTSAKNMQCELEIAVLPDHSHPFIPGQRTVIRFRLFG